MSAQTNHKSVQMFISQLKCFVTPPNPSEFLWTMCCDGMTLLVMRSSLMSCCDGMTLFVLCRLLVLCRLVLSLCVASRMWVRHRSLVIVPPEGGLEFRWDSEMCWCFIHVTIKLVMGTTQKSAIESCITHVSSSHEKQFGARGKCRGFSPAAAARPLDRTRIREDSVKRGMSWRQTFG